MAPKFHMNITAKILPAHSFPNITLFKIFNRLNLNFGVTIVAVDLKLLRKKLNGSFSSPKIIKSIKVVIK